MGESEDKPDRLFGTDGVRGVAGCDLTARLATDLSMAAAAVLGVGGKVGPDLTGSNRANLDYLLENIIDPSAGQLAVVLTGIAGAVIGGTAMLGGVGTMIGMWFGVLVLGELQDGFLLRGISAYKYLMIEGGAILVFMIVNTYLSKLRGSGRLVGTSSSRRAGAAGVAIARMTKL